VDGGGRDTVGPSATEAIIGAVVGLSVGYIHCVDVPFRLKCREQGVASCSCPGKVGGDMLVCPARFQSSFKSYEQGGAIGTKALWTASDL
jgi:hypothetical protein